MHKNCKTYEISWHERKLVFKRPPPGSGSHGHEHESHDHGYEKPKTEVSKSPDSPETLTALEERMDHLMREIEEKEQEMLTRYKDNPASQQKIKELAETQRKELETLQQEYVRRKQELTQKPQSKEEFDKLYSEFNKKVEAIEQKKPELERLRKYAEEHATIADLEGGWEWMGVKREEKYEYMTAMFLQKGEKPNEYRLSEAMKIEKFRWYVRLGYIFPPSFYRVRVTDEKTKEVREGTRTIRDGKIGYFTDNGQGDYIAIGENVGKFSGTKIEILEILGPNDPRYKDQAEREQKWWDAEKKSEIIGSTVGDAERGPGSRTGPGSIPTEELRRTSRNRLAELKIPETVIAKRVEARNHYNRLEGQLKRYGIRTEGLKSNYTAAALLEKGEEIVKKFQYDLEFETKLRETLKEKIEDMGSGANIKTKIEQMQKEKKTVEKFEVADAGLIIQIDITKPENPEIKWIEKATGNPVENLEDYLDKFVIEKTHKEKKLPEETPLIKFIKALQNGGKFEGIEFEKGYNLNLSHLEILEKWLTDKKYRERIYKLPLFQKMINRPDDPATWKKSMTPKDFLDALLNEGAEEPTNLPPDPHRRARFTSDTAFAMTGDETVAKPTIDIGGEGGLRHGAKRRVPVQGIIIHDTVSGWSAGRTAGYFKHAEYTPHYAISKDGQIIQIMPDDEIAHHAGGKTRHHGDIRGSVNGQTIGIDLVNWNKRNGRYDPYTPAQYKGLARLTAHLVTKYKIPMEQIMGHRVVDAHCRRDPSDTFNWPWYQKEVQRLIRTEGTVELAQR